MRRTQALTPLTGQEVAVKELFVDRRLSFESHHVFELSPKFRMSVDFLIFAGNGKVLECTYCERRKGSAVGEVRRRGANMDYRFHVLKIKHPKLVCGALLEAPNENPDRVREVADSFPNMDFAAICLDELMERMECVQ